MDEDGNATAGGRTVQEWALCAGKFVVIRTVPGASEAGTEDVEVASDDELDDQVAESPEKPSGGKRKASATIAEVRTRIAVLPTQRHDHDT